MLRIIGSTLIILSGTLLGFLKSDMLRRRSECLTKIISGLNLLETDISYGKKDLQKALLTIGENHKIELFKNMAKKIPTIGIKEAISSALKEECECLLQRDKAPILALGENLGMTDSLSQEISIKRAVLTLSESKKEAEAEYAKFGRLYRSVGVLGGILGAIILI